MPQIASFTTGLPLHDAPIEPAWITEGTPTARNRVLNAARDGSAWTMLWDCSAGSFEWHYTFDETIHFLEGGATITGPDGITRDYGPGDMVFFPTGISARWKVDCYVRKLGFCHQPAPLPLRLLLKIARRLGGSWRAGTRLVTAQISGPALFEPSPPDQSTNPQKHPPGRTQPAGANRRA